MLWLAWRLRLNVALVIAILAVSSFALHIADTFGPNFLTTQIAFASPQTRAWELLLGGLLAYTATFGGRSLPFIPVAGRSAVDARQAEYREIIAKLRRAHPGIRVFDPLERFCPDSRCIYTESGQVLYEDSNHLSHYGSDRYAEVFSRWLTPP